jgi:hypothetical protein
MMATGTHARGKTDSTLEQKTSRRTGRESKDRSNRNWIQPQPQATDQVRMREERPQIQLKSNSKEVKVTDDSFSIENQSTPDL